MPMILPIPPVITTPALPGADVGIAYLFQMSASLAAPPYTYALISAVPNTGNWLNLSITGQLSGTPTTVENETVVIQPIDSAGTKGNAVTFSLQVAPLPSIATASPLPNALINSPYSATLAGAGGQAPYNYSLVSASPDTGSWISVSSSGAISGTPGTAETESVTIKITDSVGGSSQKTLSLAVQGSGTSPGAAQAVFAGQATSNSVGFAWWPALDGTLPDTWNIYRQDVSSTTPYKTLYPGVGVAPNPALVEYSVKQFHYTDGPASPSPPQPNTSHTYWVTPVKGGVEGQPSPTVTMTTLALGPGTTPPTPPTDPATYLPPLPTLANYTAGTVWTVSSTVTNDSDYIGIAGTSGPLLNVGCSLAYAFANATAGDTIVLAAGVTYTSTVAASGAFLGPAVNGPAWTNVISSEDPVFKAGGKLPAFSFTTTNLYSSFTLSGLPVAGALSATLSAPWAGRSAYFPVLFYTNVKAFFETRLAHFVNGSSTINWNAGFAGTGGALNGNVTSTRILVHQGNYVTPDDIAAMPTIQFNFTQNAGLGITFKKITGFIRMIGINVAPAPSQTPGHTCVAAVTMAGQNILLDRCLIGNDTTLPTWSPCTRGVAANGTFGSGHQCFIYGFHYGVPHTSSNTTGDTQAWQWQGQGGVIQNSYAEAVVENIWMGGGTFNSQSFIPQNLVSRYNYSHKNGAWVGTEFGRFVKNHHEQKCGQFCEAHDNIYQNNWWSFGSAGQNGRVFNVGSIDQVASNGTRPIQSLNSDPNGLVTGVANFYGLPQGTNFTTTIAGVSNTGYNGTFLCTMTGTDNATFQYQLPSNPGPSGAAKGTIATVTQCCQPWVVVSDFKAYNNQAYGVATMGYPHQDEGQQVNGKNYRQAYINNLAWINPAGTDDMNTLSFGRALQGSAVEDVTMSHNTSVIIPSQSGNLVTGAQQFTAALLMASNSTPGSDRWTVQDNVFDGHFAFSVLGTQSSDPGGNGPSFFNLVFINPLWSNNVCILDASTGYPAPAAGASGPIAYASLFGAGFVSNTTMPVLPSSWNVTQAPYTTASTTGGPIGAIF